MTEGVILDTGPLVALLDAGDKAHAWTVHQFKQITAPMLTCEPVLAEAMYLLRSLRPAQEKILEWIERGALLCPFVLSAEVPQVSALWKKYADVPMSLADACLVRMAEQFDGRSLCTLDSDFTIYRKHGHEPIPLIMPAGA
jgi:predicted nucleic acid-binding protein